MCEQDKNRLNMCRLCLCENECFFDVFEVNNWHGYVAAEVISDLLQYKVCRTDGYPHVVCVHCLTKLTDFKVFKEQCLTSRLTYDNVFASKVDIRQDETGEFITIKAEPIDFLGSAEEEAEKESSVEVQPSVVACQLTDQLETSVINKPEECAVDKEAVYLEEQVEISYCDPEVHREVNMEEVVTEDAYHLKSQEPAEGCRSESDDLLDSLDEASQSPERAATGGLKHSLDGKVRKRRRLGLERKLEIIRKLEAGVSPAALGRTYDLNESTIRTIRKMGDKIKEALGQGNLCKERNSISKYKTGSSDTENQSTNETQIRSVRPQNVEDLIEDDPQMQSILMETIPEVPRTPRRRKVITLGTKLEIIQKLEAGMSAAAAGREYDMNESSVRTIWKMADKIKASVAHTGSLNAKITRTRSALLEKMEKLLTKWVEMQTTLGVPTTPAVVRAKALVIYERLKKQQGSEQDEPFMASKGWYDKFCKRTKIQLPKLDKTEDDKP